MKLEREASLPAVTTYFEMREPQLLLLFVDTEQTHILKKCVHRQTNKCAFRVPS